MQARSTTASTDAACAQARHPFLPFLLEAAGSVRLALEHSQKYHPEWSYAWYLQQILEDTIFAQQVEQIQAQVLIDKAVEAAPYHPGIHQTLLKAFRPERFALSGKEQLARKPFTPQEWEAMDLLMNNGPSGSEA